MAASEEVIGFAQLAAQKAADAKPTSIVAIDVSERLILTEVFLVISASSQPQMRAVVKAVDQAMDEAGVERKRREGFDAELHWVLLDYGDLIIHVQLDEDREFYALEKLWADCPQIDLGVELPSEAAGGLTSDSSNEPSTLDRLLAGEGTGPTGSDSGVEVSAKAADESTAGSEE